MGSTDWGGLIETGANAAGSWFAQDQASDDASDARNDYTQDALALAQQQNTMNRDNAEWQMNQNMGIADDNWQRNLQALKYNRPEMQSDFGSTYWKENEEDGTFTQHSELAPELQGALSDVRGQYGQGINNLDMGDFGVNNDVMSAIRGLQEPGLSQNESAQRARYAAMGIPIQSEAMDRGEQSLNQARTDADLQAILGGNTAWQQGQANLRNNLGSLAGLETAWNQNNMSGNRAFSQISVPNQNEVGATSPVSLSNVAQNAANYGNLTGQATGNAWNDTFQGISNAWGGQ